MSPHPDDPLFATTTLPRREASIEAAADVMDAELIRAEVDGLGRLPGTAVDRALRAADGRAFAVVASAGTENPVSYITGAPAAASKAGPRR